MTARSLRALARPVICGFGLSGCAAAMVLAVCSAAAAGVSPKWMTYLPTEQAGVQVQTPDIGQVHKAPLRRGMSAIATNLRQPSTCVCEQLFTKALEVAVDQRQNACE